MSAIVQNVVENQNPIVFVKASDMNTQQAWESWANENGLITTKRCNSANVVLWIGPNDEELFDSEIPWEKIVCVGKEQIEPLCKENGIVFLLFDETTLDAEAIIDRINATAEKIIRRPALKLAQNQNERPTDHLEHNETILPKLIKKDSGNHNQTGVNVQHQALSNLETEFESEDIDEQPETISSNVDETSKTNLQRELKITDYLLEDEFEQSKTILLGFSSEREKNDQMQSYIETATEGNYRVGATATSWKELKMLLKGGEYDLVIVYKKMNGLEIDLISNLKSLRKELVRRGALESRIIVFEKFNQSDDLSIAAKSTLEFENIEWLTVQKLKDLPTRLLKDPRQIEDPFVFEDDDENEMPQVQVSHALVHKPLLIATHSSGGGIGKSTGAVQLGFWFSHKGYKTLLLELDQEKPSVARSTGIPKHTQGITSWTKDDFRNEDNVLLAIKRTAHTKNKLTVLPVAPVSGTRQMLPFNDYTESEVKNMIQTLIRAARKEYQIIVVDTNPIIDDAAVNPVLREADTILFLMEATEIFLDSACGYLDLFQRLYLEDKVKYVVNKHTKSDVISIKQIEETLESEVIKVVPNDTEGYRRAAYKGKPYKPSKGPSPWQELVDDILSLNQISVMTNDGKKSFLSALFKRKRKQKN